MPVIRLSEELKEYSRIAMQDARSCKKDNGNREMTLRKKYIMA